VFRRFPAGCVRSVVKPFPFDEVKQTQTLVTMIELAVQDPIDLPLIWTIQIISGGGLTTLFGNNQS